MEIKKKLNSLKYNKEQDINIFIATLQNLINELENIDHDMEQTLRIREECYPRYRLFQFKRIIKI